MPSMWSQVSVFALEDQETGYKKAGSCITFQNTGHYPFEEVSTMSMLFFANLPYNCSERELQEWVESRGIEAQSVRIVRDLVAGVSPAFGYVGLRDDTPILEAVSMLNGKKLRRQTILVQEAQARRAGGGWTNERKTA